MDGAPSGDAAWARAALLETVVLPVFQLLAHTSNLPVMLNLKNQTSPHQELSVVPVCSGEVSGNVWWEQVG